MNDDKLTPEEEFAKQTSAQLRVQLEEMVGTVRKELQDVRQYVLEESTRAEQLVANAHAEQDRLRGELEQVTKERDALRVAFAEASHNAGPAFVAHEELARLRELHDIVMALRADLEEESQLREQLVKILRETGDALKGPPAPLHAHSWHDLAEVAAKLKALAELTPAEHAACLARCAELMDAEAGSPQGEELRVLGRLVEHYEKQAFPI